ncbi:MAG: hypothetical protein RR478_04985 [Bacilli bacterium]
MNNNENTNIPTTIKEENKEIKRFCMIHKTGGKFYNAFGIDAFILNVLFEYKVMDNKKAGFPDNSLEKVTNTLNSKNISYQVIVPGKDPIVKDFKKASRYDEYCKIAYDKMNNDAKKDSINKIIKEASPSKLIGLMEVVNDYLNK